MCAGTDAAHIHALAHRYCRLGWILPDEWQIRTDSEYRDTARLVMAEMDAVLYQIDALMGAREDLMECKGRARPVYKEVEPVSRGERSCYTRLMPPVANEDGEVCRIYIQVRPIDDAGCEFEEVPQ